MESLHIQTPLIRSVPLSQELGTNVWLKLECLQPTGSFKIRGIGYACAYHQQQGVSRFISSSGGNAGIAAAYAGMLLDLPVAVFVPETTTERAIKMIEGFKATVTVTGATWQEAHSAALAQLNDDSAFIHPFDDPLIWQGHSSLVTEVTALGLDPGAYVTAIGGGGLFCGLMQGIQEATSTAHVLAVETHGAASLAAALTAGEPVALPAITSIATSLGASQICQQAFDYAQGDNVRASTVSDEDALAGCRWLADQHRLIVEPACGAAIAAARSGKEQVSAYEDIVIVVCGGVTSVHI